MEGNSAEKEAIPNKSVSGYEIIDEIKAKLEEECPETVSCADIVALATRDAVSYQVCIYYVYVYMGKSIFTTFLAKVTTINM